MAMKDQSVERWICIHGHFYQPPRENPWLEAVEWQVSASPYHDWNERITVECYAPNAASRILDGKGRILELVNNYARIAFDFGPTLMRWLEVNASQVYQAILEADRQGRARFSGHGPAMAQAYNHMILPLANHRDRVTQVRWGIEDFRYRFGRDPEGMWLPETAVDLETLDILAEHGIRFVILAPHQAIRVRPLRSSTWQDVTGGRIDPTMPYLCELPSGRKIALFFYDGPISRAVAFEHLLNSGEDFVRRLMNAFLDSRARPQLVHISTDGETYGHHHPFGDMALAYALKTIESNKTVRLTHYGEFLERYPPTHCVEIRERTSWSCIHGVDRWQSDCGCHVGSHPNWNQKWRTPLRNALDGLRDQVALPFEMMGRQWLKDPWAARDDYIHVILRRSPESIDRFFARNGLKPLELSERVRVLKLMELQRHAMLMYTSCAWFFDDISGIETIQVLQYAARVIQLAEELFGQDFESHFLNILGDAKSNLPDQGDGRTIYERYVRTAISDLKKVAAHYTISSLFRPYADEDQIFCYAVERDRVETSEVGKARLMTGRIRLASKITLESEDLIFGVLHMGDHHVHGGVSPFQGEEAFLTMQREVREAFLKADFAQVERLFDRHFGASTSSLHSLFKDEQRRVVRAILQSSLDRIGAAYEQIYQDHLTWFHFLRGLNLPLPKAFLRTAEQVLNHRLQQALEHEVVDIERIQGLLTEAKTLGIDWDLKNIEFSCRRRIEEVAERFAKEPLDLRHLDMLGQWVELTHLLPCSVHLWRVENVCVGVRQSVYPDRQRAAEGGDPDASEWIERFKRLCDQLAIAL